MIIKVNNHNGLGNEYHEKETGQFASPNGSSVSDIEEYTGEWKKNDEYKAQEMYKKSYQELIGDDQNRLYRYREWANNSNNDYKEYIYNDLKNGKKTAALNFWYNQYKLQSGEYDLSFKDFLNTPMKLYRATNKNEKEDVNNPFFSYATNRKNAERFLDNFQRLDANRTGEIEEVYIAPIDTLGMFPSDEDEIIVPNPKYEEYSKSIKNTIDDFMQEAKKNNIELPYDSDYITELMRKHGIGAISSSISHYIESEKKNHEIGDKVFDINATSIESVDSLFDPNSKAGRITKNEYLKYQKGKNAKITYMTADEYIKKCADNIFGGSIEDVINGMDDPKDVDKYAESMKNGDVFPVPYLNYANHRQEGRHRALAFKKAFGSRAKMPVIEVTDTDNVSDEEWENYQRKRYEEKYDFFKEPNPYSEEAKRKREYEKAYEQKEDEQEYNDIYNEPEKYNAEFEDLYGDDVKEFDFDDLLDLEDLEDVEEIELEDVDSVASRLGLTTEDFIRDIKENEKKQKIPTIEEYEKPIKNNNEQLDKEYGELKEKIRNRNRQNKATKEMSQENKEKIMNNPYLSSSYDIVKVDLDDIAKRYNFSNPEHPLFDRRSENWGTNYDNFEWYDENKDDFEWSPIRLESDGSILDGNHRLYSLWNMGYKYAEVLKKKK